MFTVYVLKSARQGKRYVGSTANLAARLRLHNQGRVRATKGGRPWELVHSELFETNAEARHREMSLKSGKGRAELDDKLSKRGSAP
jgi:putative endonuclease